MPRRLAPFLSVLLTLALTMAIVVAPAVAARGPGEPERMDGYALVRVEINSLRDARVMNAFSDDPWTCRWDGVSPGLIDFGLTPEALAALRETDLSFRVLIPDVQKLIDTERAAIARQPAGAGVRGPGGGGGAWFDDYKPIAAVSARVNELVAARPDLASRVSVGSSVLNAEIFGIRITGPAGGQARPPIVINACQHAREWITVMSVMYLAEGLISNYDTDPATRRLVDAYEWIIIPVVNPDGYDFSWTTRRTWRKNRRDNADTSFGVDLNRNWGVAWNTVGSSDDPANDTFHGTAAFSEPETRALRDFIASRPEIALQLDVHSFSQLILQPRGSDWSLSPDAATFRALGATMQSAMFAVAGQTYSPGEIYRNIYPVGGGITDWVYGENGAGPLAMSFELRDLGQTGFILPAAQIVPASQELVAGVRAGAEWLLDRRVDIEFVGSDGPPRRVRADAATPLDLRLLRGGVRVDGATPPVLHQRVGRTGPFAFAPMASLGADELGPVWRADVAGGPCGSVVQFHVEVRTTNGATVRVPAEGEFESAAQIYDSVLTETFEAAPAGWLASDPDPFHPDNATVSTRWTLGDPNGTVAQTEFDRTPLGGANCYFTGVNARGNSSSGDVDNGKTTLISPPIDLSEYADAEISMWIWFSNNRGEIGSVNDELVVDIISAPVVDAGGSGLPSPAWVRALTLRAEAPIAQATGAWRRYTVRVGQLVSLSPQVRVRLVASDVTPGSYVEAALDDFEVVGLACATEPCAGDWNGNGTATVQDIFDFLADYFDGRADADSSGTTSVEDLFVFLGQWFAGC